MSIDEASRHQLIRLLGDAITPAGAVLLMEYLPPVGWADVATRRDLDALAERLDLRIDALRFELQATMHQELAAMTRTFVLANTAAVLSAVGLAFAAARFA